MPVAKQKDFTKLLWAGLVGESKEPDERDLGVCNASLSMAVLGVLTCEWLVLGSFAPAGDAGALLSSWMGRWRRGVEVIAASWRQKH